MDFQMYALICLLIEMLLYFFIILNSINSDIDDDTELRSKKKQ
jgi:hypothetical protein